jgi:catechol 2,3-dioxygenase-like lactoylglutathione lyase family enzyme
MVDEFKASTCGVDHVGLTVRDLVSTRKFFCDCLGWRIVGERPDYPAVFVSDGHDVVTLWQVESPGQAIPFDRRANVGLHHLALAVVDQIDLDTLYKSVELAWRRRRVRSGTLRCRPQDPFHRAGAQRSTDRVCVRSSPRGRAQGAVSRFRRRLAGKRRTYCE